MVNPTYEKLGSAPSMIRELFAYGLRRSAEVGPENVFDYSLGNPSIPAPQPVQQALLDVLHDTDPIQVHGYSMAGGFDGTRRAVAEDLTHRFGMTIRPEELFFTCGAAAALISVIRALTVSPDSEFVAIAPYFPEYLPFVESNGGKLVSVPADLDTFQISLDILEAHLTSHTQAVLVNSPNNPTGVVYSRQTLEGLAELLRRKSTQFGHPIYLIADEPYRELVYDGVEVPFLPTIYPNTLVCYSYSKSLSLPGERIGYVCVPSCVEGQADVLHAVAGAARSSGHVCPPTLVQLALQRCADARPDLAAYDANRRLLYRELTQMGYECIPPQGAFYIFVRVPDGDDVAFSQRAKLEHDLLVVPSTAFHCPGFLRLSYCVSHDMILRSLPAFRAIREKYHAGTKPRRQASAV